jgi:hypothetical protein
VENGSNESGLPHIPLPSIQLSLPARKVEFMATSNKLLFEKLR